MGETYIYFKKKAYINDLCDKINLLNRHVIGVPKEDERKREQKKYIFEAIMTQSFPNLIKILYLQVQGSLMKQQKN